MPDAALPFVWDYALTEEGFRAFLAERGTLGRRWALRRLLVAAEPEVVWRFLTLQDVVDALRDPELPLPEDRRRLWEAAVESWTRAR